MTVSGNNFKVIIHIPNIETPYIAATPTMYKINIKIYSYVNRVFTILNSAEAQFEIRHVGIVTTDTGIIPTYSDKKVGSVFDLTYDPRSGGVLSAIGADNFLIIILPSYD